MIQIDDKILSLDLFDHHFACDLPRCRGACCIVGESGAPLTDAETGIIDTLLPVIKHMLSARAIEIIGKTGAWEIDNDGDKVTPVINKKECVYTYFDEGGTCKCTFERAFNEGLINFKKPVSCHLYPIRITKYQGFEALNYHTWDICAPARETGARNGIPVFRFLEESIARVYGDAFYNQVEEAYKLIREQGKANSCK